MPHEYILKRRINLFFSKTKGKKVRKIFADAQYTYNAQYFTQKRYLFEKRKMDNSNVYSSHFCYSSSDLKYKASLIIFSQLFKWNHEICISKIFSKLPNF